MLIGKTYCSTSLASGKDRPGTCKVRRLTRALRHICFLVLFPFNYRTNIISLSKKLRISIHWPSICTDYRRCRFNLFLLFIWLLKIHLLSEITFGSFPLALMDWCVHLRFQPTTFLELVYGVPSHAVARAVSVPWHFRDRCLHNMPVFC